MTQTTQNLETRQALFARLGADRLAIQAALDRERTPSDRNRMGQFATAPALAGEILSYAVSLLPDEPVRFLDPAIGTGAFYEALLKVLPAQRLAEARGFEVDPHYGEPASELWKCTGLDLKLADFTRELVNGQTANLVICNPPYVRHHHLENAEKGNLVRRSFEASGIKLSGLAGLYCHFMLLAHRWLGPGALSGWLIPSEFMDVNYGRAIKRYLLERVTLLHIHRFDPSDVQFADALVSSAVVWFQNSAPPKDHNVLFSFGGSLKDPHLRSLIRSVDLAHEPKWTRFPKAGVRRRSSVPVLSNFFRIKRGIATGNNSYFILDADEIERRNLPLECFRPILPSPRYLETDEVLANGAGMPKLQRRLFLLDPTYSEEEIQERFQSLWAYLEEGKAQGLHERYLCRHRAVWYAQENRPPAPIVCTYLGRSDSKRGRPFRFILNHSQATVANVYLAMYPTAALEQANRDNPELIERIWKVLNELSPSDLLGEGRVYGGGLHKLEPKELANVPVPQIAELLPKNYKDRVGQQGDLFGKDAEA